MVVAPPPLRGPSRDTGTEADVLRVANLGVRLDHVPILEDVSFHVRRGTTLSIVGPNGAGKTTLFRVLLGLVPHTGTVNWSGPVRIGYVPQNFVVTDVPITVRDFLGFKSGAGFEESRTVIGTSVTTKFCGTYPIRTGPDQLTVPVCGTSPRRTRKRVVFPAPFGPTIASVVPRRTWKLTPSKIGTWSNRTPRFETRRTSASVPVSRLGPLDGGGATTIRRGSSDAVI